jgi:hypothetical protein
LVAWWATERWHAPHFICHGRRIERNFRDVSLCIAGILLHSTYEETDIEKLAHEVDRHPPYKTDSGKLARKVDLGLARDNALVPDQKEHNDDVLAL